MTTPEDPAGGSPPDVTRALVRLTDAIAGERRWWHEVSVSPDDIAAVLNMVDPPVQGVDTESLAILLLAGAWTTRASEGIDRLDDSALETALDWECHSCRPDVGWPKWSVAERDLKTGVITIYVECGHCGSTTYYDASGNELEESR